MKSFKEFLKEATNTIDPELIQKASNGDEDAKEQIAKGVYSKNFKFSKEDTSEQLKPVDISKHLSGTDKEKIDKVLSFLKEYGMTARFFTSNPEDIGTNCSGFKVEKKPYNLKKHGYEKGNVWIYNPCDSHGSFNDIFTTLSWRIIHETAHAITEELMHKKYGASRRMGAMNFDINNPYDTNDKTVYKGLSLKEAERSIEWEDVAFRAQEILFRELGVKIPKENHVLDFNIATHDVIIRLLTGDFSDPGAIGILPNSNERASVKDVLVFIEAQYKENAKYLGSKAENGIDLNKWKPVSQSEIKASIEKFKKNPKEILERYFGEA